MSVGIAAAAFALIPDIDSAATLVAVVQAGPTTVFPTTEHVWTTAGWSVHRSLTHSLLVGATTALLACAVAIGYRTDGRRTRTVSAVFAIGLAAGLVGLGAATDGTLGGATMALFVVASLAATTLALWLERTPRQVGAAAAIGLLSHPFGDVFMGRPPAFLYPLWTGPSVEKVTLAADPTVNLILLFALELSLAWIVLWIVSRSIGCGLRPHVEWPATLALGFAAGVLIIRPPTLDVAYHFALGTLAAGVVLGGAPALVRRTRGRSRLLTFTATGLAAITVAVTSYLLAYLLFGP